MASSRRGGSRQFIQLLLDNEIIDQLDKSIGMSRAEAGELYDMLRSLSGRLVKRTSGVTGKSEGDTVGSQFTARRHFPPTLDKATRDSFVGQLFNALENKLKDRFSHMEPVVDPVTKQPVIDPITQMPKMQKVLDDLADEKIEDIMEAFGIGITSSGGSKVLNTRGDLDWNFLKNAFNDSNITVSPAPKGRKYVTIPNSTPNIVNPYTGRRKSAEKLIEEKEKEAEKRIQEVMSVQGGAAMPNKGVDAYDEAVLLGQEGGYESTYRKIKSQENAADPDVAEQNMRAQIARRQSNWDAMEMLVAEDKAKEIAERTQADPAFNPNDPFFIPRWGTTIPFPRGQTASLSPALAAERDINTRRKNAQLYLNTWNNDPDAFMQNPMFARKTRDAWFIGELQTAIQVGKDAVGRPIDTAKAQEIVDAATRSQRVLPLTDEQKWAKQDERATRRDEFLSDPTKSPGLQGQAYRQRKDDAQFRDIPFGRLFKMAGMKPSTAGKIKGFMKKAGPIFGKLGIAGLIGKAIVDVAKGTWDKLDKIISIATQIAGNTYKTTTEGAAVNISRKLADTSAAFKSATGLDMMGAFQGVANKFDNIVVSSANIESALGIGAPFLQQYGLVPDAVKYGLPMSPKETADLAGKMMFAGIDSILNSRDYLGKDVGSPEAAMSNFRPMWNALGIPPELVEGLVNAARTTGREGEMLSFSQRVLGGKENVDTVLIDFLSAFSGAAAAADAGRPEYELSSLEKFFKAMEESTGRLKAIFDNIGKSLTLFFGPAIENVSNAMERLAMLFMDEAGKQRLRDTYAEQTRRVRDEAETTQAGTLMAFNAVAREAGFEGMSPEDRRLNQASKPSDSSATDEQWFYLKVLSGQYSAATKVFEKAEEELAKYDRTGKIDPVEASRLSTNMSKAISSVVDDVIERRDIDDSFEVLKATGSPGMSEGYVAGRGRDLEGMQQAGYDAEVMSRVMAALPSNIHDLMAQGDVEVKVQTDDVNVTWSAQLEVKENDTLTKIVPLINDIRGKATARTWGEGEGVLNLDRMTETPTKGQENTMPRPE